MPLGKIDWVFRQLLACLCHRVRMSVNLVQIAILDPSLGIPQKPVAFLPLDLQAAAKVILSSCRNIIPHTPSAQLQILNRRTAFPDAVIPSHNICALRPALLRIRSSTP